MARVQESIEINAPTNDCYQQWMKFEEFPQFMDHVKSITKLNDNLWHWVVDGPLGTKLEWDAKMDGAKDDRLISWHTVSDSNVKANGNVLFEEIRQGFTRVTSTLEYEAPAGMLGETIANVFSNPDIMIKQDLINFKALQEKKSLSIVQ